MMRVRLAICAAAMFVLDPSYAAVRICSAKISAGPFTSASEQDAKKQALDAWKAEAAKVGSRFSGWGTATDRRLSCKPEGSAIACTAEAVPCTIEQAPNTLETRSKRIGI